MEDLDKTATKLHSSDEEMRRVAVGVLAAYPFESIRMELASAMGDESWRVRKETVDLLLRLPFTPDIAEFLVEMLRSQENAGLRNSAVESLERIGKPAIPVLSPYIDDSDNDVRKFIIDILGNIGDPVVVPKLIGALADGDPNVSAAAAENLGKIGDPAAVPHLIEALRMENVWLCHTILEALRNIGKPVPVEVVAPLASDPFLKKGVYDCLGVVGNEKAIPLLLEGFSERARSSREAAVVALMKVVRRVAGGAAEAELSKLLKAFRNTKVVENLTRSLDSADRIVKEAVVAALGMIGDARSIPALLRCCHDELFRRQCIAAIGSMGSEGVVNLLQAFSLAPEEERCLIAFICGELSCSGASEQLLEGMKSTSPQLRKISVLAAGKIRLTALINDAALLLDDGDPEVREAAIHVLSGFASLNGEGVRKIAEQLAHSDTPEKRRDSSILYSALKDVEKLSRFLKDEDPGVRKSAVLSLSDLKDKSSAGILVMALADEDADVRIAAAGALGAIGGDDTCDALLLALGDDDIWVQCAAVKSLTRFDAARVLPAFEDKFRGAEGMVLVSLLQALAEIGSEQAWELVARGLDNPDPDVVKSAINMLERDGDLWIHNHWPTLISHPHWDVRSTFARVVAAKLGVKAAPILKSAHSSETDDLVKGQIAELLGGLE